MFIVFATTRFPFMRRSDSIITLSVNVFSPVNVISPVSMVVILEELSSKSVESATPSRSVPLPMK